MDGVYLQIDNTLILNRNAESLHYKAKLHCSRFATCRERWADDRRVVPSWRL